MNTFKANTTYVYGWIGNSELKTEVTVVRRTKKNVWVQSRGEEVQRKKIHVGSDGEYFYPTGTYSMAPTCHAKRVKPVEEAATVEEAPTPTPVINIAPSIVEEAPVQEEVVKADESNARKNFAEADVELLEEEGILVISNTIYGTITAAYTHTRNYVVRGSIELKTANRAAFIAFLSSAYTIEA